MSVVHTCSPADRDQVVSIMTAAFAADPVVTWLLGERRTARSADRHRRRFFRMIASPATIALGGCDLTDGGATVWYPPGTHAAAASPLGLSAAIATFGRRIGEASRADATMRANHPAEPHWYLSVVGVDPARTGGGIGTALLQHRLAQIDAEHDAAYLESSLERNVVLYERLGFVVLDEVRVGPGAPPEWRMWRAPRS